MKENKCINNYNNNNINNIKSNNKNNNIKNYNSSNNDINNNSSGNNINNYYYSNNNNNYYYHNNSNNNTNKNIKIMMMMMMMIIMMMMMMIIIIIISIITIINYSVLFLCCQRSNDNQIFWKAPEDLFMFSMVYVYGGERSIDLSLMETSSFPERGRLVHISHINREWRGRRVLIFHKHRELYCTYNNAVYTFQYYTLLHVSMICSWLHVSRIRGRN